MTIDELQAEFPIGSRWAGQISHQVFEVVALGPPDTVVVVAHRTTGLSITSPTYLRDATRYVRIPDPVPCPITEPVTLHSYARHGNGPGYGVGGPFDEDGGYPPITLHPPFAPVDAIDVHVPADGTWGIYTWGSGPA